jgi:TonB family protein
MRLPRFHITERQVLLWILAGLFLAYAATFIVASLRRRSEPIEVNQPPRVRRMPPTNTAQTDIHYFFADMFDPSLMSLPNQHGFSQQLWHGGPVAQLPPTDWNIRPSFLRLPGTNTLVVLLHQPPVSSVVENLAEKLPSTETVTNAPVPFMPAIATNSTVSIVAGTLDRRELLSRLSLPVVTNNTALRATRVRVAVRPDGEVEFASLERGSGNEAVDAQSLEWSRQLQFVPLTGDAGNLDLMWGVVRFAWTTVPPLVTNAVPAVSAP